MVRAFNLIKDAEKTVDFIMDYVEENDYMINCAYDSMGRDELKRFFCTDFLEISESVITGAEEETGITLDPAYKAFLTRFYAEACGDILVEWIRERESRNRELVKKEIIFTSDILPAL